MEMSLGCSDIIPLNSRTHLTPWANNSLLRVHSLVHLLCTSCMFPLDTRLTQKKPPAHRKISSGGAAGAEVVAAVAASETTDRQSGFVIMMILTACELRLHQADHYASWFED